MSSPRAMSTSLWPWPGYVPAATAATALWRFGPRRGMLRAVPRLPSELDTVWTACAEKLDLSIGRGGDAFVHFDGRTLWIARDEDLDDDDTLAQLIFHELCHVAVQGPAKRRAPDWGLDSSSDRDLVREHAAVRLQAHLGGWFGLRGVLFPTTEVRAFYESLPADALGAASEPSSALARMGAARAGREPLAPAFTDALGATARLIAAPVHRSGWVQIPIGDGRTCGTCSWRSEGGACRQAARRVQVGADDRACVRHEPALDCLPCGACCRSGFDVVPIGARDAARRLHPELVRSRGGRFEMARVGERCAALAGLEAGPYTCGIYDDRPRNCRDLEVGGRHCLAARRRVGLSP